jgi:hypothetical protein
MADPRTYEYLQSDLVYTTGLERAGAVWIQSRDAHILTLGLSFVQSR